jgi:hypothetical protein
MTSRFWRAGSNNAVSPNCNFLTDVGGGGSTTTWAAATDWFHTNSDLTTERTGNTTGGYAPEYATKANALGRVGYHIVAIGAAPINVIGMGKAGITTYPGNGTIDGIGWHPNGTIELNVTGGVETTAAWTAGDFPEMERAASGVFKFYLGGVLVKTVDTVGGGYGYAGNLTGSLFPIISSYNATGLKVSGDFSLWL